MKRHLWAEYLEPKKAGQHKGCLLGKLYFTIGVCSLAVMLIGTSALAQRYQLRDGRSVDGETVVVRDGHLVRNLQDANGGQGEIAIPVGSVVSLDWPMPDGLRRARAALATGATLKALEEIGPVVSQFAPFAKVPGSWWGEAELVRIRALLAAGKKADARKAAEKVIATAPSPVVVAFGRTVLAGLDVEENRDSQATAALREIRLHPASSEVEADLAVVAGDLELKHRNWEAALEAYLEVSAFHGHRDELLPKVLLGSARAYRGLNDTGRAERAVMELLDDYPKSPQAAKAREEFPQ